MIIAGKALLQLVKENNLVENLSERELTNPEGAGFDLRLGQVHKISGKAFLGIDERNTAHSKLLLEFEEDKKQKITIHPGEHYLFTTIESVNLPQTITANLWSRSTLYRSGMILSGGNVAPGYSGTLSFGFFNGGQAEVEIELGARIVHILFFEIAGEANTYRGQWQGGRVTTSKREKQI